MKDSIKTIIGRFITEPPHSKYKFLDLNPNGKLLDVGCGNVTPFKIKSRFPNIFYTSIDICDYNQQMSNVLDEYIITTPDEFANTIENLEAKFDMVISSHNLEHCNDREKTLLAMIKVLKVGGYLYLAFPSEDSVNFPNRKGCLNYYDDTTHKNLPPNFDEIVKTLKTNNLEIIFASKSYKPFLEWIVGFFQERKSKKDKEVKDGTWSYWGFVSVIWAKKSEM